MSLKEQNSAVKRGLFKALMTQTKIIAVEGEKDGFESSGRSNQ